MACFGKLFDVSTLYSFQSQYWAVKAMALVPAAMMAMIEGKLKIMYTSSFRSSLHTLSGLPLEIERLKLKSSAGLQ